MENRSIAKTEREGGWELFEQTQGTLRTTLKFRRVKPETLLSKAWGVFRGLAPAKQRVVAAGMAILLLFAAVGIGIASAQDKGTNNAGATNSTESAAVNVTPTPSPAPTSSEETDQVITAENNKDLAALLVATDYCDPSMAQFAAKYQGQKIEFDGSITNMQKYDTRYDILLGPGNAGPKTTAGPAFKYKNVNMFDLKFTGKSVPSYMAEGDKFRFTAEVGEYQPNQGCLFFLTPVSTTVR
jgi:hypothetical protein